MLARADEIGAAHGLQCFAQHRPVFGVVIAQKRLVQTALANPLHNLDLFGRAAPHRFEGIEAAVIHGRRERHRRGQISLDLIGAVFVAPQPERQIHHVLVRRARMGRDKIGN